MIDLKKLFTFGERAKVRIEGVPVEIFRAGDYGEKGKWSEADLDGLAQNLDPALHEPPITLHHDDTQGPHGVIERLERRGKSLFAVFKDVSSDLAKWLEERPYAKRSIEIYRADKSPNGKPMVRALSFVTVPAVKGMSPLPVFSLDERGEYAAYDEGGPDCLDLFAEKRVNETWNADDGHCHYAMTDEKGNGMTGGPMKCGAEGRTIDDAGHTHAVKFYIIQAAEGHTHAMSVTTGQRYAEAPETSDDNLKMEEPTMPTSAPAAPAVSVTAPAVDIDKIKADTKAEVAAQFNEDLAKRDQRIAELERSNRRSSLAAKLRAANLPPAVANYPGLAEFCERLAEQGGTLKFSDGGKDKEIDAVEFLVGFAETAVKTGPVPVTPTGATPHEGAKETDHDKAVNAKAVQYQEEQAKAGKTVDFGDALIWAEKNLGK